MSLVRDAGDMSKIIKRMVKETMENEKPTRLMYGKVESTNPLKVNVEQRLMLDRNFLVLTDHLTRKSTTISFRDNYRNSNDDLTHTTRTAEVVFDNSLRVGDKVALLREQGGQKFLIIDKVVSG